MDRLIALIRPKLLLTYGKDSFERLSGRPKRNRIEETKRNGIPLIRCGHLIQGARLDERAEAIDRVRRLIS